MFGLSTNLNIVLVLCLALAVVVNCDPEPESVRRDEILRALYRLNGQNNYRLFRSSRSGKPTFIRFGKRSNPPFVSQYDQPEDV